MRVLPWNLCTSFAAAGALVAYGILGLMFGWHWEYLPGALLGLLATYVVSTALGAKLTEIGAGQSTLAAVVLGCAAALLTLLAGALAIGLGNFAFETTREVLAAPGGQPLWNRLAELAPGNAFELILTPFLLGTLIGALPALSLGLVYGVILRAKKPQHGGATRDLRAWVGGGTGLIVVLLGAIWFSMFDSVSRTSDWLASSAIFISDCGEIAQGEGVLVYCRGVPCTQARCDYAQNQDAFALLVQPPPGAGWSWAGGGLGTTRRLDEAAHNLYWVRRRPDGTLGENSPRRHQRYKLRINENQIVIGKRVLPFRFGMLLLVRYAEDWSYTVHHGADALREANLSIDALQRILDEACAESPACEQAFQLRVHED